VCGGVADMKGWRQRQLFARAKERCARAKERCAVAEEGWNVVDYGGEGERCERKLGVRRV